MKKTFCNLLIILLRSWIEKNYTLGNYNSVDANVYNKLKTIFIFVNLQILPQYVFIAWG